MLSVLLASPLLYQVRTSDVCIVLVFNDKRKKIRASPKTRQPLFSGCSILSLKILFQCLLDGQRYVLEIVGYDDLCAFLSHLMCLCSVVIQ